MTALVLDLRGNRGGLVDQAQKIANIFLYKDQKIVSMRGRPSVFPERVKANNPTPLIFPSSCWSIAARHRRRKFSPARCKTMTAASSLAKTASAKDWCRASFRCATVPADADDRPLLHAKRALDSARLQRALVL